MSIIVQKFGGTSVANRDCFENAAHHVMREVKAGHQVVVVVSAMAGETNRLIELARQLSLAPDAAEYDVITSSGEQVSCGLLSIALQEKGISARSLLAWQVPFQTCGTHSRARYQQVSGDTLKAQLNLGNVVVIPGFQGISPEGRITTLGRGGSDITAVATAAALGAERCDIYTDVKGIYTADPKVVKSARVLKKLSYEEMLELSSQGAKVLQNRAVSLAMNQKVPVRVLSSFEQTSGTWIISEDQIMEKGTVRGITHSEEEACITLKGLLDQPGTGAKIFMPLAHGNIPIDMVSHSTDDNSKATLSFIVPREDLDRTQGILTSEKNALDFDTLSVDANVAKITIVGTGLRNHPQVTAKAFEILAEMRIQIYKTSTSETKLSFLIPQEYAELAIRTLHKGYGLDKVNSSTSS